MGEDKNMKTKAILLLVVLLMGSVDASWTNKYVDNYNSRYNPQDSASDITSPRRTKTFDTTIREIVPTSNYVFVGTLNENIYRYDKTLENKATRYINFYSTYTIGEDKHYFYNISGSEIDLLQIDNRTLNFEVSIPAPEYAYFTPPIYDSGYLYYKNDSHIMRLNGSNIGQVISENDINDAYSECGSTLLTDSYFYVICYDEDVSNLVMQYDRNNISDTPTALTFDGDLSITSMGLAFDSTNDLLYVINAYNITSYNEALEKQAESGNYEIDTKDITISNDYIYFEGGSLTLVKVDKETLEEIDTETYSGWSGINGVYSTPNYLYVPTLGINSIHILDKDLNELAEYEGDQAPNYFCSMDGDGLYCAEGNYNLLYFPTHASFWMPEFNITEYNATNYKTPCFTDLMTGNVKEAMKCLYVGQNFQRDDGVPTMGYFFYMIVFGGMTFIFYIKHRSIVVAGIMMLFFLGIFNGEFPPEAAIIYWGVVIASVVSVLYGLFKNDD